EPVSLGAVGGGLPDQVAGAAGGAADGPAAARRGGGPLGGDATAPGARGATGVDVAGAGGAGRVGQVGPVRHRGRGTAGRAGRLPHPPRGGPRRHGRRLRGRADLPRTAGGAEGAAVRGDNGPTSPATLPQRGAGGGEPAPRAHRAGPRGGFGAR